METETLIITIYHPEGPNEQIKKNIAEVFGKPITPENVSLVVRDHGKTAFV